MKVNYDIAVPPVETVLSENRVKVLYVYGYPDKISLLRDIKIRKRAKRVGWKQYDSDSVVYCGDSMHIWFYTVFFKREKPNKRIKKDEELV